MAIQQSNVTVMRKNYQPTSLGCSFKHFGSPWTILHQKQSRMHIYRKLQTSKAKQVIITWLQFLYNEWTTSLDELGVEHPQSSTTLLLSMIWDHICEFIWMTRNNILYSSYNHISMDELSSLRDKMRQYQDCQDKVLDYIDISSQQTSRRRIYKCGNGQLCVLELNGSTIHDIITQTKSSKTINN